MPLPGPDQIVEFVFQLLRSRSEVTSFGLPLTRRCEASKGRWAIEKANTTSAVNCMTVYLRAFDRNSSASSYLPWSLGAALSIPRHRSVSRCLPSSICIFSISTRLMERLGDPISSLAVKSCSKAAHAVQSLWILATEDLFPRCKCLAVHYVGLSYPPR